MKRILATAAVVALGGCGLDKQNAPGLTGPSELGLSLQVSATPDHIMWDGKSQAVLEVIARDASSQPIRGLSVQVGTDSTGQLSSSVVSTNSEGKASVVFHAPAAPPPSTQQDAIATVAFNPIGTNYGNSGGNVKLVEIRLMLPFVVLPPDGAPVPRFFATPTTAKENEDVYFDGSASTDDTGIASYRWAFGDGGTGDGQTTRHSYGLAGTYQATLTVTDIRGNSRTSAPQQIQVGEATNPTAVIVFSPTAPKAGQNVFLNASASTAPTGRSIVSYQWDFGDGAKGSGVTPQHIWGFAGTYNMTLVVTDSSGRVATITQSITILP